MDKRRLEDLYELALDLSTELEEKINNPEEEHNYADFKALAACYELQDYTANVLAIP